MFARELFFKGLSFRHHNIIVSDGTTSKLLPFLEPEDSVVHAKQFAKVIKQMMQHYYQLNSISKTIKVIETLEMDISELIMNNKKIAIVLNKIDQNVIFQLFPQQKEVIYVFDIINTLRNIEFQQIKDSNHTIKLNLQIKKAGLELISKLSHKYNLCQKQILKLFLFEKFDPTNRIAVPYSKITSELNLNNAIQLIKTQIPRIISIILSRNIKQKLHKKAKKFYFINQNCKYVSKIGLAQNSLFKYFINQTNNAQISQIKPDQKLFVYMIKRSERTILQIDQVICNMKIQKKDSLRFKKFVQLFLQSRKVSQKLQLANRTLKQQVFRSLDLNRCIKKTMKNILDEVQTAVQIAKQRKYALDTLKKYFRSFKNIRYCASQSKRINSVTKLEAYLKSFLVQIKHKKIQEYRQVYVNKIQKNIRCFLTKKFAIRQAILETQHDIQHEICQPTKLLQQILNKNHEAKPFEKLAFVNIQVLCIRNTVGSLIFSNLQTFLQNLMHSLKGDEFVKALQVKQYSLSVVTNKRKITHGITSQLAEDQQHPKQNLIPNTVTQSKGLKFTTILDSKRQLHSTGLNRYGQLGCGIENQVNLTVPHRIPIKQPIRKVSCGLKHTICLTNQNTVYAWGYLQFFYHKSHVIIRKPEKVEVPQGVILDVESSNYNSFILYQNKTMVSLNDFESLWKQQNINLLPFQIVALKSSSIEILLIKKLNFSHTNLSLKDKKQIARSLALRDCNKKDLFSIPFDSKFYTHFNEKTMPRPNNHLKFIDLNETNLLHEPVSNSSTFRKTNDLTFSQHSSSLMKHI